jgi:Tfp pilus assembly protein PilF
VIALLSNGRKRVVSGAALMLLLSLSAIAQQGGSDWAEAIRSRVEAKDLAGASELVETQLRIAPDNVEAMGWRARLLSWTGHWSEAEATYRTALDRAPNDSEILIGLADVLIWQSKSAEALAMLERALAAGAAKPEVLIRRGRVLASLNRTQEAQVVFRELLTIDPNNAAARAALDTAPTDPRHELRIGTDIDSFNYTDTAAAGTLSLRSRWAPRWTTFFATSFYQRFGANAEKATTTITYRLGAHDWVTAGGALANKQLVVARAETYGEFGHGFRTNSHFVRGLDVSIQQRVLWFPGSQVAIFGASHVAYLSREFTFTLSISAARSRFNAAGSEWTPSGYTRLGFRIAPRLTGTISFGLGAENFANLDQIGHFSARTYGGGMRCQLTRRHDISGYLAVQDRSQGRTQTSMGLSYGVRF